MAKKGNQSMTLRCDIFNEETNKKINTIKGEGIFFATINKISDYEQLVVETHLALADQNQADHEETKKFNEIKLINPLLIETFLGLSNLLITTTNLPPEYILKLKQVIEHIISISPYESKTEAPYQNKLN